MSVAPSHEHQVRRGPFAHLRPIDPATAKSTGLLSLRDMSHYVHATPGAIRTWMEAVGAAPVGIISGVRPTVGVTLYDGQDAALAVAYARNAGLIAKRPGNGPVTRVGMRAPTAGRPYQWRDPFRSQGTPTGPVPEPPASGGTR